MSERYLVAGLGNPGFRYKRTRHNIGFMAIDHIVKSLASSLKTKSFMAELYSYENDNHSIIFVKPMTFMNRSGFAIAAIANEFKIKTENILIIYDDVALDFGRIRIRGKGSSGGHNGLESIIEELGTSNIPRLRVGIGSEKVKRNMVNFVLSKFTRAERKQLLEIFEHVNSAVNSFINNGLEKTMNVYNAKPKTKSYQEE